MNNLIKELIEYGKQGKAEMFYRKCLRVGKHNLAKKIKIKYNIQEPHDDMVSAFCYGIMVSNNYS